MKILSLILALLLPVASFAQDDQVSNVSVSVCFSPNYGGADCTEAITNAIGAAQSNILVQAYVLTSRPIIQAMVEAKQRGIDVRVIVDPLATQTVSSLISNDIPVFVDHKHRIAHNKVIVVDGLTVITGSFNFTASAEHANAENVAICRSRAIADLFTANWKKHLEHSVKLGAQ